MSGATATNYNAILKTIWPQDDVTDEFIENIPLFAMMPKDTTWDGEARVITVQYGATNGASAKFSNAKANKQASKLMKMTLFTADNFSLWSIDHKLVQLSRSNKGAIIKALTRESRSALKKLKRRVGMAMWGSGGGAVAQITTIATNTITVTDYHTVRQIEVGDFVNIAPDDGYTGSAGIRTGTPLQVSNVLRQTSGSAQLTFTTNVTANYPGAVANDFLFIDGDYASWTDGAETWVPSSDPGTNNVPTTIHGANRTADVKRQSGIRVSGTGLLIKEAIKKAIKEAYFEEADISHIFLNPDNYLDLELDLGTAVRYVDNTIGNVGFQGIRFTGLGRSKPIEVYPDPDCPYNKVRGFELDEWTFASAGEFPDFLSFNGSKELMLEENANSGEGRIGGYSQLYNEGMGHNFVLQLG